MSKVSKRHHMQIARSTNILKIRDWINKAQQDHPDAEIDREALVRKAMMVLGATRNKVEEYLDVIGF